MITKGGLEAVTPGDGICKNRAVWSGTYLEFFHTHIKRGRCMEIGKSLKFSVAGPLIGAFYHGPGRQQASPFANAALG